PQTRSGAPAAPSAPRAAPKPSPAPTPNAHPNEAPTWGTRSARERPGDRCMTSSEPPLGASRSLTPLLVGDHRSEVRGLDGSAHLSCYEPRVNGRGDRLGCHRGGNVGRPHPRVDRLERRSPLLPGRAVDDELRA